MKTPTPNASRAQEILAHLHLEPHPEGGAFSRVYAAPFHAEGGTRSCAGSIYFLLQGAEISHLHRIDCDELWYYHEGCGLRLTLITPERELREELLGADFTADEQPLRLIPAGTVFAAENLDPRGYTLISCVTAPQFTYEGFELFRKEQLLEYYGVQQADSALVKAIARLALP